MYITKELIEEMEREGTFKDCTSSRTNPRPDEYVCVLPMALDKPPVSLHFSKIKCPGPGDKKLSFSEEEF